MCQGENWKIPNRDFDVLSLQVDFIGHIIGPLCYNTTSDTLEREKITLHFINFNVPLNAHYNWYYQSHKNPSEWKHAIVFLFFCKKWCIVLFPETNFCFRNRFYCSRGTLADWNLNFFTYLNAKTLQTLKTFLL